MYKQKRFILIGAISLVVLFLPIDLKAQITFERTYGGEGIDNGYSVQQTTDGGYNVVGTGAMPLIKTDPFGDTHIETIRDIIKNDFLVNDDSIGGCTQEEPAVAMDSAGNFVVVWQDWRNSGFDLYAQRYNSLGEPLDSNFRVNDDLGVAFQMHPSVAMDNAGNFVVVWIDPREGDDDTYAQRYNSLGEPLGSNFKVNDNVEYAVQYTPSVGMDNTGNFVVAWHDTRGSSGCDIYAQRYNSSGEPQDSNFRVNDDTGTASQKHPSVALDSAGNFVIVWKDKRNGGFDIYAQMFNNSGVPQDTNFRVDQAGEWWHQEWPVIAIDNPGNFVVAWFDWRNNTTNIYARLYDYSGTPQGSEFWVSGGVGPSAAMDPVGNFIIAWGGAAQRYNSSGIPQGQEITLPGGEPSVAMDDAGNLVIAWKDGRNSIPPVAGTSDIYAQRYDSSGNPQEVDFIVNDGDNEGSNEQWVPAVAMDGAGNYVVVFCDKRDTLDYYGIYAQRYDNIGNPQGANFRASEFIPGPPYMIQWWPAIAMNNTGDFVVVWEDNRDGYSDEFDIYAQRFNSLGIPQGVNFMVNEDIGQRDQWKPSVTIDNAGNFVVVWEDRRNDNKDIYAQRYDSLGNAQGTNFRVNDDPGISIQSFTSVAMDSTGNFIVVWTDKRNIYRDIYAQLYDSSGTAQGSNFRVNDNAVGTSTQWTSSVAMDNTGSFVVVWDDRRNGNSDIYAQRYDNSGIPQGINFRVSDDSAGTCTQQRPSVAMDPSGSRFIIVWTDRRKPDGYFHVYRNPDIYAQIYENGNPVGPNVQVNEQDEPPYNHQWSQRHCVACNHNMIAFTWQDNRRHKCWDIYGKLTDWDITVGIEDDHLNIPNIVTLLQNYPNPFNPETKIRYSIPADCKVELKIYNIKGQLVRTLVDEKQEKGTHTVIWNGKDKNSNPVASGIYLYRIKTVKSMVIKKMILLR